MTHKHALLAVFSCIVAAAFTACSAASPTASPVQSPLSSPAVIETPSADKAAVSGTIMQGDGVTPFAAIEVFFAEVTRAEGSGIYVVNTASSPWALTKSDGSFRTRPMPPGEYVIVVGDPVGKNSVIVDESGKPKVWNFAAGAVFDVGTLKVDLR